jgi:hypothetical protein
VGLKDSLPEPQQRALPTFELGQHVKVVDNPGATAAHLAGKRGTIVPRAYSEGHYYLRTEDGEEYLVWCQFLERV